MHMEDYLMNLIHIISYISIQLTALAIHEEKNNRSIKGIANTFAGELFGSEIDTFLKMPSIHLFSLFCVWEKSQRLVMKCFIYSRNTCCTQQEHRLLPPSLPISLSHGETTCVVCLHILIRKYHSKRFCSFINKREAKKEDMGLRQS